MTRRPATPGRARRTWLAPGRAAPVWAVPATCWGSCRPPGRRPPGRSSSAPGAVVERRRGRRGRAGRRRRVCRGAAATEQGGGEGQTGHRFAEARLHGVFTSSLWVVRAIATVQPHSPLGIASEGTENHGRVDASGRGAPSGSETPDDRLAALVVRRRVRPPAGGAPAPVSGPRSPPTADRRDSRRRRCSGTRPRPARPPRPAPPRGRRCRDGASGRTPSPRCPSGTAPPRLLPWADRAGCRSRDRGPWPAAPPGRTDRMRGSPALSAGPTGQATGCRPRPRSTVHAPGRPPTPPLVVRSRRALRVHPWECRRARAAPSAWAGSAWSPGRTGEPSWRRSGGAVRDRPRERGRWKTDMARV